MTDSLVSEPPYRQIAAVMIGLLALPILALVLGVPRSIALIVIAASCVFGVVYGAYWTICIVYLDRWHQRNGRRLDG